MKKSHLIKVIAKVLVVQADNPHREALFNASLNS